MKNERLEGDVQLERQVLIGLITSKVLAREVSQLYRPGSLSVGYIDRVAKWCLEYYQEFKDVPRQHIQDIFRRKEREVKDETQTALIAQFLSSISEEYTKEGQRNDDYIAKEAERYFRLRAVEQARDLLSKHITSGKVDDAEQVIAAYHRITRPASVGIDPFADFEYVEDSFLAEEREQLFSFKGDLGRMMGPFHRGWFCMVVGTQGRGKTWWLLEVCMRALLKGYNILFVSFEMTQKQMIRRAYHWLTGRPTSKWAGQLLMPTFDCVYNQDGTCDREERIGKVQLILAPGRPLPPFEEAQRKGYRPCTSCRAIEGEFEPSVWFRQRNFEPLTNEYAISRAEQLSTLTRGGRVKLLTYGAGALSVKDLRSQLDNWEYYDGWQPDIVITDYSDKMAPDNRGEREYRHKLNDINVAHKALAIDKNILVVSASQSSTGREESRDIESGDWAEDIRKRSEIDMGWSLNQTPAEKRMGVMRVKGMKQRHDDYSPLDSCMVLQQLKIGKPYLDSYWTVK